MSSPFPPKPKDHRADDDDAEARPTPKQSGSFGVMQEITKSVVASLEAWLDAAPLGATADILEIIQQARRLGREVEIWEHVSPPPEKKSRAIDEILQMREAALKLADRYGHVLK